MAYPAGFSSDEDEFGGFMSDDSTNSLPAQQRPQVQEVDVPQELTPAQKLTNLFFAIMNGNLTEVESALNTGIDVNVDLRDGWTPLLLAASVGNADITRELINRGANVNADRDKYTVLMAVCSCPDSTSPASKCLDVLTQLLEKGADVDAITRRRKTALMFAASNGNSDVVAKLLLYCNIQAEDNQGWNALFWAVNDNKPEVVQILLDAGLNTDKADVRGNTALRYAISQEFDSIVKILSPQSDDPVTTMQETFYEFETVFEHQSPQFFRDVCCLLYGMKCENLINLFANISLLEFLCLNDEELQKSGVVVPYQRNRVLTGLHKFHKCLYKQKSIPVVPKNAVYSTIDVSNALISAVRQLITMEASLKYISDARISSVEDKEPFKNNIIIIRNRLNKFKKTVIRLNSLTQSWDSTNYPVDLITSGHKKRSRWLKWFGCISLLLFSSMAVCKIRQNK